MYRMVPLNKILLDSTKYNTQETGLVFEKLGFCNDVNQTLFKDLTIPLYSFISSNAYFAWQNPAKLNEIYSNYFTFFYSGSQPKGMCAYYDEYTTPGRYTIPLTSELKTIFSSIIVLLIGAGGSGGAGGGDKTGQRGTSGAAGGGGGFIGYKLDLGGLSFTSFTIAIGTGGASVSGNDGTANNGKDGIKGEDTILTVNSRISSTIIISRTSAQAIGGGGGGGGHATSAASPGLGGTTYYDSADTYGTILSVGSSYSGYSSNDDQNTNRRSFNGYYAAMDIQRSSSPLVHYYPQIQNAMTGPGSYGKGGAGTPGRNNPNNTPTGRGGDGYARVYYIFYQINLKTII